MGVQITRACCCCRAIPIAGKQAGSVQLYLGFSSTVVITALQLFSTFRLARTQFSSQSGNCRCADSRLVFAKSCCTFSMALSQTLKTHCAILNAHMQQQTEHWFLSSISSVMIPAKMICGIFVIIAIKCISEVFFWSLLVTNLHRRQQPVAAAGLRVGQML